MTASRRVLAAAVLAATLAPLSPTGAADAATCTPRTRVLDTSPTVKPMALGRRGHAVTFEAVDPPEIHELLLHSPDGTTQLISDDTGEPSEPDDVNARGEVVGSDRVGQVDFAYEPWVYRREHLRALATPGEMTASGRRDYLTAAINDRAAVIGVKTNAQRGVDETSADYVAKPVLWSTPRSSPIVLGLPRGMHTSMRFGQPLLDVRNEGTVLGIVHDDEHRYLALWVTPGAPPDLRRLRDAWLPTDIAGQWVIGEVDGTDRVFVRSWTQAWLVDGPEPLESMDISASGSFAVNWDAEHGIPWTYVGTPDRVGELGYRQWVVDMTGSFGTQVLSIHESQSEVITCALELPESDDIVVTPLTLR